MISRSNQPAARLDDRRHQPFPRHGSVAGNRAAGQATVAVDIVADLHERRNRPGCCNGFLDVGIEPAAEQVHHHGDPRMLGQRHCIGQAVGDRDIGIEVRRRLDAKDNAHRSRRFATGATASAKRSAASGQVSAPRAPVVMMMFCAPISAAMAIVAISRSRAAMVSAGVAKPKARCVSAATVNPASLNSRADAAMPASFTWSSSGLIAAAPDAQCTPPAAPAVPAQGTGY